MKYVKIYNEKMQCLGVADIEQNYDKDGYVKLFDATTMKFQGVVDVDDIPESGDNMPVVKVFDENMQPCGVVTADNIRHSDGYLILLQKDPSTTGSVSGGGRFIAGTSVTVVATPDAQSDYPEFDGWYENGTKVSENASYTFTVEGARTLVAKFKKTTPPPPTYKGLFRRLNTLWGDEYDIVDNDGKLVVFYSNGNLLGVMSEWDNSYEYQNPNAYTNIIAQWGSTQIEVTELAGQIDRFTYDDVTYELDKNNLTLNPVVEYIYH